MKKIVSLLIAMLFIAGQCFSADISDWKRGDASIPVKGTDNVSDIDVDISNYIVDPIDKLLSHYKYGCELSYTSANVTTVAIGEVVCSNSAGTIHRFRKNTSTTTVDLSASGVGGLDTGSEASSTLYYIYAVADADATTFTAIASTSSSAPTGITYFYLLGAVRNDSSSNIVKFYQAGRRIFYDDVANNAEVRVLSGGSAGSFTDVDCSAVVPKISQSVSFQVNSDGAVAPVQFRVNGSSATTGIKQDTWGGNDILVSNVPLDSSQVCEYKVNANAVTLWVSSYELNS